MSNFRKEREFDGLFQKYGHRWEWFEPNETFFTDLRSSARQWCAHTVRTEYEEGTRDIYLDFLDNRTVNAAANIQTDDFVAINRGTIDTLLGVFGQLLSHPSSWPRVGNSRIESEARALGPNFFCPGAETTLHHVVPRCAQRQHFTVNLTTLAFYFLVMHEVGHLRNGHLDLLHIQGFRGLAEISSKHEPSVDPVLRQTLEIDADSYAAAKSVAFAIERIKLEAHQGSAAAGAFRDAYGDHERSLHTLAFAVYVLFRIFSVSEGPTGNFTAEHPPSWLRLRCTNEVLGDVVGKVTGEAFPAERFGDCMFDAIIEAEESIARISSRPVDPRLAMAAFAQPLPTGATGYLEQIANKWTEVRPDLDRLKRGGVLPR